MKEYNIKVNFLDGTIDCDEILLVQNDYNSTKFNFKYDANEGTVALKMLYPDGETAYITDVTNGEFILSPGLLSQDGEYQIELSAYSNDGKLTGYSIMNFYARPELIDTDEIVEPDDRVPILDDLITQVDNININVTKADSIATIVVTKKDGTSETVYINDGVKGDTGATPNIHIGNVVTGNTSSVTRSGTNENPVFDFVLEKGDQGIQGIQGIQGETGLTPNIQIGTVTSGDTTSITITGTQENPVLNFVLEKGDTGSRGQQGEKGDTGDSGVRISETEPVDEVVNVWIDESDTATIGTAEEESF